MAFYLASVVTGEHALWPFEALGFALGGAAFSWDIFRLVTMRRARQVFIAGGRAQEALAQFASAPPWRGVGIWGQGVLWVDLFGSGSSSSTPHIPPLAPLGLSFWSSTGRSLSCGLCLSASS